MPEKMDDMKALARTEALDIIADFKAETSGEIENLADGLLRSLKSYDQGPDSRARGDPPAAPRRPGTPARHRLKPESRRDGASEPRAMPVALMLADG